MKIDEALIRGGCTLTPAGVPVDANRIPIPLELLVDLPDEIKATFSEQIQAQLKALTAPKRKATPQTRGRPKKADG